MNSEWPEMARNAKKNFDVIRRFDKVCRFLNPLWALPKNCFCNFDRAFEAISPKFAGVLLWSPVIGGYPWPCLKTYSHCTTERDF